MAQMYDQYMYKTMESYDAMAMQATAHDANGYMSGDQTFHTPSFGDEEFEIPPLTLPPTGGEVMYNNQVYSHPPHGQNPSCSQPQGMADHSNIASTPSPPMGMANGGPHHYPNQAQDVYVTHMGEGSPGAMMAPHSVQLRVHSYGVQPTYRNSHMQPPMNQHHQMSVQPHLQMVPSSPSRQYPAPLLTTVPHPASMSRMGVHMGTASHHGSISPPGSNHTSPGLETSEDSDDSTLLSQVNGGLKRPSPGPPDSFINNVKVNVKKPKVQKKKKKRDPNEPQKPVSAYALFFRDTQAAIKGQNPNASFGEVSKIVASMWDSLDTDHKNVYKKKTETAKKEYLKALAAYRASLVSRAANDQPDLLFGNSSPSASSSSSSSPPGHALSPLQKKSPLLTSLMEGSVVTSFQNMTQPQPPVLTSQNSVTSTTMIQHQSPPHLVQSTPAHVSHNTHQMMHNMPPGQMVPSIAVRPAVPHLMTVSSPTPPHHQQQPPPQLPLSNGSGMASSQVMIPQSSLHNCIRNGCPNPSVESPEWDREYCSNECVVSHCRDVFSAWVSSRQASNTYASVK